ncbi:MAG: HAD-IIB family hydrolase [Candidatus Sumerlaeota bacterium]
MPVKLIIADVDGCLSPEESVAWNLEAFADVARELRNAAPPRRLTLCTGRPQPYVEVLMKLLDIRDPAICENGAVYYTLHDNYARFCPGVTEEKILGLRALRAFIETDILPKHPEAVMQFGKEAQMSIFSRQPDVFAGILEKIEAFLERNGGPDLLINTSHFYLNISLTGVDKGNALKHLLEMLGLEKSQVAGIGDTEGDLPLREQVGFFACPANSREPIKKIADYVSPYPDIRGMVDILQRPEMQPVG